MKLTPNVRSWFSRLRRNEHGAVLAELAIVLPILILLVGVTAEFGRFFYTYSTLAKATRAGARYISSRNYKSSSVRDEAANMVVCGKTTDCGSETILAGFDTSDVDLPDPAGPAVPATVTVGIVDGFVYTPIFDLGLVTLPLDPSTTMRYLPTTPFG